MRNDTTRYTNLLFITPPNTLLFPGKRRLAGQSLANPFQACQYMLARHLPAGR
jgi:hypothetical protein